MTAADCACGTFLTEVAFPGQGSDVAGYPLSKAEAEKLSLLREFTLDNAHFYCETADITRPFPSLHDVQVAQPAPSIKHFDSV